MRKNRKNEIKAVRAARISDRSYENSVSSSYEKERRKRFRIGVFTVLLILGIMLVSCVASLVKNAWELNEYFGYAVLVLLSALCILFIVFPLSRLFLLKPLRIKVNKDMIPEASRANLAVLKRSAKNLIAYHNNPSNVPYISEDRITELKSVMASGDAALFTSLMGELYKNEIAKKISEIIRNSATRSFVTTALSQSDRIDFLSSLFINISETKQIVFTYGFRPTTASLFKIFFAAMKNSVAAFCMENLNVFSGVTNKLLRGVAERIPVIDVVVDSTCQGAANALLTSLLGRKVKRLLFGEFREAVDMNGNLVDDDMEDAINEIKSIKDDRESEAV